MPSLDAVDIDLLREGIVPGLVVALVVLLCAQVTRRVPLGGIGLVTASVVGLAAVDEVPSALVVGLVVLAVAGAASRLPVVGLPLAIAGLLVGAVLLATEAGVRGDDWVRDLVALTIVAGGPLMASFDQRWGADGLTLPMSALSLAAVYAVVPDTEQATVLLGAALPFVLVSWPGFGVTVGTGGAWALVGLLAWEVGIEGPARPGAVIGGLATLGLFVVEPLVRLVRPTLLGLLRRWLCRRSWGLVLTGAAHGALALYAARVVGLRTSAGEAAVIVVLGWLAAGAVLLVVATVAHRSKVI